MIRVPQRRYSPAALEYWFERLTESWEEGFAEAELREGRELYRAGEVRTLELSVGHAMVHGGRAKDDIYAVLEWPEGGKLSVRHSVSDRRQGRALAAAGLYEIEEFVVEEASPLPASEHASAKKKQPEPEAAVPAPDPPARPSEPPPRP
ncbi:MAG: ATP-dependent helicase, partial [Verrucomicrobiota bacterium]